MRNIAALAILASLSLAPHSVVAQESHLPVDAFEGQACRSAADRDFDAAIETIATSSNRDTVNAAGKKLREGGLPAIGALAHHLADRRRPPSNYLTRAVSGRADLGDHCFWLIQDILESHTSKLDASYSPLDKQNVAKWLADREGKSLAELRRDACIGAFAKILAMGEEHPQIDIRPTVMSYAKRLVELDQAVSIK